MGMAHYEAWITQGWQKEDSGIMVLVVKRRPNGRTEVSNFLVDRGCLGVKDAYYLDQATEEDVERIQRGETEDYNLEPIDPSRARAFVEAAVEYANRLGFAPPTEYRKAKRVLSDLPRGETREDFTFGRDGKPFYIQGPYDSDQRASTILAILEARLGEGGFGYLLAAPLDSEEVDGDEDESGEEEDWEDEDDAEEDGTDPEGPGGAERPIPPFPELFQATMDQMEQVRLEGAPRDAVMAVLVDSMRDLYVSADRFLWNTYNAPSEDGQGTFHYLSGFLGALSLAFPYPYPIAKQLLADPAWQPSRDVEEQMMRESACNCYLTGHRLILREILARKERKPHGVRLFRKDIPWLKEESPDLALVERTMTNWCAGFLRGITEHAPQFLEVPTLAEDWKLLRERADINASKLYLKVVTEDEIQQGIHPEGRARQVDDALERILRELAPTLEHFQVDDPPLA